MNTPTHQNFLRSLTLTSLLGLSVLVLSACSEPDRTTLREDADKVMQDTKTAVSGAWDNIKDYTYERREEFSSSANAMAARLDAEVSELRADYAEAQASASRRAAMDELRNARATFDEKLSALGRASADTWEQAKRETMAAWDRVQAAYHKAKAESA